MKKILPALLILSALTAFGQTDFYDLQKIQEIKIQFGYDNWDYRLDTAKAGKENYLVAEYCTINGVRFDSVGVKYKGNSSYRDINKKNPLHIKLNFVKEEQEYQQYTSLKLGNNYADPSVVREILSYQILANYMDCSKANFAKVYLNGQYFGLYTNVEAVNKKFCSDHFGSDDHVFIKGNPDRPGPMATSNLKFISYDSTKYYPYYDLENEGGWSKLIAFTDSLRSKPAAIPKMLDIDRALWMHAFNNIMSNYDSYTGSFAQNYYLYADDNGRFLPIVWDLNMAFGGFPGAFGGGNTATPLDKISILFQAANADRPLIAVLLANPTYKRMYLAHLRTIAEEFFENKQYETLTKQLQSKVDSLVKTDPASLTSYTAFQNSLTAPVPLSGGGVPGTNVPGIFSLMNARLAYYKTTPEYVAAQPVIGSYTHLPASPKINDTVWIRVPLSNLESAFIGYRKSKNLIFQKRTLYDDGLHHDGAAGDGVYGNFIVADSRKTQFYLYAENANAGLFSPRRAEYEYHIIEATPPAATIQAGELVINELMPVNNSTVKDPTDDNFEDWAELYNTTDNILDLSGLFLTDDATKPQKWAFPAGTLLPAKSRLIVWLDEDSNSATSGLHANFRLSGSGEELVLTRQDGLVLNTVVYGPIPADQSYERCPDGTGNFSITAKSTFALPNCTPVSTVEAIQGKISLSPNPTFHTVHLLASDGVNIRQVTIFNHTGQRMLQGVGRDFDVSDLPAGLYFVQIRTDDHLLQVLKFVKRS